MSLSPATKRTRGVDEEVGGPNSKAVRGLGEIRCSWPGIGSTMRSEKLDRRASDVREEEDQVRSEESEGAKGFSLERH